MIAAVLGLAMGMVTAGDGPVAIPEVRGTTFAGETVALPEALKGRVGVLIVGFSEASRKEAADWGHKLADDPQRPAELAYYEMPVLESVPRLLRGWVLKKIKESVSQNGQKHFLPILGHEAEWKKAVQYNKADDAYLLVVDGNGVVRWRGEGALSDAAYAEVKRQVAEVGR